MRNTLNQDWITIILVGVFLTSVIGVIAIASWVLKKTAFTKKERRLNRFVAEPVEAGLADPNNLTAQSSHQKIDKFREGINKSLQRLSSEKLKIQLSSAYWAITDIEYLLIRVISVVLALILGSLILDNLLGGIFLAAVALMVPPILLDRAIVQRQKKFQTQLLDVLILIKGAVQAGYGLMQALDVAVSEIPAPASEEFGRVLHEVRIGLSLENALLNLGERMESDDLQIVVTAIIINTHVGGNLSTVLESAIDTIRDRMHLLGEIRSLTSYGRYVGNFLTLMPFLAGLAIFMISPGYFDSVQTSMLTQIVLFVALLGVIIGNVWMRQIVKIKV